MGLIAKKVWLAGMLIWMWSQPVAAQQEGELVASFSNVLVGVSVLLIAVSFMFVMVKLARLIDVISARYEDDNAARTKKR